MRVWTINPKYLDHKRLYAQNNECHGLSTCILKGQAWGSISAEFRHSVHYIKRVHDNIAIEMGFRKGILDPEEAMQDHKSPLNLDGVDPSFVRDEFVRTLRHYTVDTKQLREKWSREAYYFGHGTKCLTEMERKLGIEPGIPMEDIPALQERNKAIFNEHKHLLTEKDKKLRRFEKCDAIVERLGYDPFGRVCTFMKIG